MNFLNICKILEQHSRVIMENRLGNVSGQIQLKQSRKYNERPCWKVIPINMPLCNWPGSSDLYLQTIDYIHRWPAQFPHRVITIDLIWLGWNLCFARGQTKGRCGEVVRWDVALLDSYLDVSSESDHLWSQLQTRGGRELLDGLTKATNGQDGNW